MKFENMLLAAAVFIAAAGSPAFATNLRVNQGPEQQSQQQAGQQSEGQSESQSDQASAAPDGSAQNAAPQDLPAEAPGHAETRPPVPQGTRLLVGLQNTLGSKEDKRGKKFVATTLEPVTTAEGTVIPAGVQIRGHIDKVQSAGTMGRARMWLTFDEIGTPRGWRPLVAQLIDAPGVHSIHVLYDHEGEIQAASSKRQQAMEAAAAGALVGAATGGVASGKEKEAAMAAAMAAATAYMAASGLGQELTLEKGMKLELVIERPLHLGRT
ncbi:MAG TPA: hypothetical protein VK795_00055 [Terriglobales bacterium]|nr:hypothetical protein [Terriglobales bacterium]